MDDLINRKALLDDLGMSEKTRKYGGNHSGYDTMMLYEIQNVIELQPPVKPQLCEDCISRQAFDEIKELMTDINGDTVYAVRMSDIRQLPSVKPQERIGYCENCKYFRKLPYHADTLGKCVHHTGFCPKGDWYCADFETQESEENNG